ncbi:acylneuraminate cytidylyltransferase family protein [Salipiger aestuarii]|uniref:acylneuraminate cytidylyltransferase family protein n=1 Tax=Salipiger aestuarii TaxID=568098 RepID=UPI00123B3CC2|nr:acylneuraminate cytidylyltransferase family protein [Salipiger aestuarii]KAA8606648.1 hypothetical protein AL037_20075 [Salipiger aestuarii]
MSDISLFLPLRAGSTRAVDKNIRPFRPDGRSLFQHKMEQLTQLAPELREIVVSTNDRAVMAQFEEFAEFPNVRLVERPEALCLSTTKVQDLIDYVPTLLSSEHVFWVHATSPFIDAADYRDALARYRSEVIEGPKDSLMSVTRIQQFLWDDHLKAITNCDRSINPWPNTQDLTPLYEINHAFYISSRLNYLRLHDRIGIDPALFVSEGLKKYDIDWEDDFIIAQNLIGLFQSGEL